MSDSNIHDAFAGQSIDTRLQWCIDLVGELSSEHGKFYSLAEGIRQRLQPANEDEESPDHVSGAIAAVLSDLVADCSTHANVRDILEGIREEIARKNAA